MNIFDAFDRIYLINLPERTDRLRESLAELARGGVTRDDPRLRIFPGVRPENAGAFPSRGAPGCYLSHLGVLRDARREGIARVLILEDDFELTASFAAAHPALVDRLLQPGWAFAYPGHAEAPRTAGNTAPRWRQTDAPLVCAHFYAVHGEIIPRLVDYLECCMQRAPGDPRGGPMHVDGAYSMFRARERGLLTLIANPSLAAQRSSRSDIYPNKWYDRLPFMRAAAGAARRARNWLRRRTPQSAATATAPKPGV